MKKNTSHVTTSSSVTPSGPRGLRIKSGIKTGGPELQHNETALRAPSGLRIKSGIKAGPDLTPGTQLQHNETGLRARSGLRIKSGIKVGGINFNHNETLLVSR